MEELTLDGARLFPVVRRGNGHTRKHRRVPQNIRKHVLPVRVMERWHRLPRGAGESLSSKIFRSCQDVVLGNWFWVALLEQGAWMR